MKTYLYDNKYKVGEIVCAKENPALKLVIRRFDSQIYYCKVQDDLGRNDLVYFERDLVKV